MKTFYLILFFIMASFYIPSARASALSKPLQGYYVAPPPTPSKAWVGSAITAGASLLGGMLGNRQQSKNINKQIQAQKEENQKNREYNLMLAQQQNAWNIEQWERENEYNSPEKQMERLRKGGVNPDLYVGGGAQNLSASSPAMTAGAASTATDMSMLGQKPTLGQAIQTALRDSMLGAQIDNIKADTKQKEANAKGKTLENDVQEELKNLLGLELKDINGVNEYLLSPQAQKYIYELRSLKSDASIKNNQEYNSDFDRTLRELNADLEKKISSKEWRTLSSQLDMSEKQAKEFVENTVLRLRGLKADVSIKESDATWNSAEILKNLPEGLPLLVKFCRMLLGK